MTENKEELRARARKRRRRAFRGLILRILSLLLVVYILFFHLVGLTAMPNGDMYPRLDAGDLVLFYRLEETIHAQDVVVFQVPAAELDKIYSNAEGTHLSAGASANTSEEQMAGEKPFWRKALTWLGIPDLDAPAMTTLVLRVVAAPGDTVEISEGERLVVNGNSMIESNIFYNTPEYQGFQEYPLTLGDDEYFLLADYRNGGADSRFFGPVKRDQILGTVITILRRNKL